MSLHPSEPQLSISRPHLHAITPPPPVTLESIDERLRMLADHVLATQQLVRSATFPARLPLWAIACALFTIAGLLAARLILGV